LYIPFSDTPGHKNYGVSRTFDASRTREIELIVNLTGENTSQPLLLKGVVFCTNFLWISAGNAVMRFT